MEQECIKNATKLLWRIVDLGILLDYRYNDSGIFEDNGKEVILKLSKIGNLANDWKEYPLLTNVNKRDLQWLGDKTNEFNLMVVVTMVNKYLEQEYNKETIETEPLAELSGHRLIKKYPDRQVVIEY